MITPSYASGFAYNWELSGGFVDPVPWEFVVQQAPAPTGPWTSISPRTRMYRWAETVSRQINKDAVLYFRIQLVTPKGTYVSNAVMPYGDLKKREYLIAQDIMRQEILHARTLAGTPGQIWLVSTFGPRCTVCVDPITGGVRDAHCKICFGTGRLPAYHGPYETWWTFSNPTKTTQMSPDGSGTLEPRTFTVRMIGTPSMKKNDLVVDSGTGKRYYVDNVQVVAEIRRIPIVQMLTVHEAPLSDVAYKVA